MLKITDTPSPFLGNLPHDNVERFSLGGAAHRPRPFGIPWLESAPVSEKRVALNRSPRRQGYGH